MTLAAGAGLTIHELFLQRSSLEEAFMELTRDSVEYHAETPGLAASLRSVPLQRREWPMSAATTHRSRGRS